MIYIKSPSEIELMRPACRAVAITLKKLRKIVRPGISTKDLDNYANECLRELGAKPGFLNYNGYPATLCVSVNEEIVHGIPSASRILKDGDIVSMDMGAVINGFYGDAAITVPVGSISGGAAKLIEVTERSLEEGLSVVRAGVRLGDVSSAIGEYAEAHGMGVIEEFTGHGVGRRLHEDPSIPNFGHPGTGPVLKTGMTLAIEPMLSLGDPYLIILEDGWTAVTEDGSYAAHFEHTVAVTDDGCEILTME